MSHPIASVTKKGDLASKLQIFAYLVMSEISFQPSSAYIPIRDDAGPKSLSRVEREFITSAAAGSATSKNAIRQTSRLLRTDGRAWNQLRSHRLELARWDEGASATVQWGSSTRIICVCTASIVPPPNPDRPAEGAIRLSVDLSPAASTSFRFGQPVGTTGAAGAARGVPPDPTQKLLTNRILRSLERILILGGAMDTEALCVTPQHWVWELTLSVTVLDASGGNLMDACTLACMAALRHYRKPHLETQQQQQMEGSDEATAGAGAISSNAPLPPKIVSVDFKEPTPLPIHHTPLSVSFALMPRGEQSTIHMDDVDDENSNNNMAIIMDPNAREELALASNSTNTLVIAMNVHGEVCLLDFGGCEISPIVLKECAKLANQCVTQTLCPTLEQALKEADEKALQERLDRLQKQTHADVLPPQVDEKVVPPTGIPFWQQASDLVVEGDQSADQASAARAQAQAEEALRRQALDYNVAHVPSKVRENPKNAADEAANTRRQRDDGSSALLAALMKSVQASATTDSSVTNDTMNVDAMKVDRTEPRVAAPRKEKAAPQKMEVEATPTAQEPRTTMSIPGASATSVSALDARLDSDEEDVTMELTSEFAVTSPPKEATAARSAPVAATVDDDVDDLAAAIKKKKKKSKK
ncbi:hypothetical protein MPSEU_000837700 [Mayamaea pseudoterrestris]|nr:hypothetical protein MPSEU_000837700 [Mayamaea pseudoterrestris]